MIPAMISKEVTENETTFSEVDFSRKTLEKFERAKILEIYFLRLDGRMPESIPFELKELYLIELNLIKSFLLGQHPQDPLLQKIFKMMS